MERVRVDRWLWAVRLFKSRAESTNACRTGHVRVNGRPAKAAAPVEVGDRIHARIHGRERVVEVARAINSRVGAEAAAECYVDHSPPVARRDTDANAERERGAGRPTKRERRQLDQWRR